MKKQNGNPLILLDSMGAEFKQEVLAECQYQEVKKGEQIVRQSDQGDCVYFIEKGMVRVTVFSAKGKEVSFVDLEQGDNFGELSAIDGGPRLANVVALTDATIIVMSSGFLISLLGRYPQFNLLLLKQLTAMIRRLCDRIVEYSTMGVPHRLYAELLRLAKNNLDLDGVVRIEGMPTHAELASRLSCTREAVSRELNRLERVGIIQRNNRKMIIDDLSKLETLLDACLR